MRDIVFRDELRYLQARFPNLHVRVLVSADAGSPWEGARGHITREIIAASCRSSPRGPVMLCGPDPMMTAMREMLVGMGVPDAEVLQEAFVVQAGRRSGGRRTGSSRNRREPRRPRR